MFGYSKRQTDEISHEDILKREIESLWISAQSNARRTNMMKAKIDKMQKNSKRRLFGDGDETISHMRNGCGKLVQ